MKDDPEYRAQVLSLLQRDLGASFAPRNCSILIAVGTNLDQYRADSWPVGNDSEFHSRSKGSFWEQRMERHKKYMELAEEPPPLPRSAPVRRSEPPNPSSGWWASPPCLPDRPKLSNTIQPSYGTQTYSTPTKARETKQTGTLSPSWYKR